MENRPLILMILDGFGVNPSPQDNAVREAKTPVFDRIFAAYPHMEIQASESFVGLPQGFMGNSEVGHLNIGAGRVVYQDFSLISRAIEEGTFETNPAFLDLLEKWKLHEGEAVHLMGLLSDGGVHSHLSHCLALIQLLKRKGVSKIYVHAFLDGRDTPPASGIGYLETLQKFCRDSRVAEIASISGRFYAMDRDNRWDRTEAAYHTVVLAKSPRTFKDPLVALRESYEAGITDEFVLPTHAQSYKGLSDRDAVIFFNFRADRARQLTRAMTQVEFTGFKREKLPALSSFVCMTPYDDSFGLSTAFSKPKVPNTIGEVVSRQGWKQLRIAETEKYAHVTYFFNGGEEKVFENEKRVLIPSPREVKTYDLKPEMSARSLTAKLLEELQAGDYRFVVINFANCDMVGHTGNLRAAIEAVEVIDECVGKIVDWVERHSAMAILTADHGNCEKMKDDHGQPLTSHTLLPVPFVVIDPKRKNLKLANAGSLCDIAPSCLALWGIAKPSEMTGKSLVQL